MCVCVRAELIELMTSSKALRLKDSLDKNGIAVYPKSPLFSIKTPDRKDPCILSKRRAIFFSHTGRAILHTASSILT